MDSLRTCITYLTNLVVRWEGSFCAIVVRLLIERLFRFMNFVSQPLLATNPASSLHCRHIFHYKSDLALNMISFLETRCIFERRCCIQLRTSSFSSTSVSFLPTTINSESFPFYGCYFLFLLDPLTDSFSIDFEFLCCTMDRIFRAYLIVACLNSILYFWRLSPLWYIA